MADEDTALLEVQDWRRDELRRLGFTQQQRSHLLDLIEAGDLELEQVRHPVDDLGWTPEQTWWAVC